jgi:hypothetical protein
MTARAFTGLGLLSGALICACSSGSPGGGGNTGATGDGGSGSGSGGGSGGGGAGAACFRITETNGMQQCGYQSVNSPGFTCGGIEPVNTYSNGSCPSAGLQGCCLHTTSSTYTLVLGTCYYVASEASTAQASCQGTGPLGTATWSTTAP